MLNGIQRVRPDRRPAVAFLLASSAHRQRVRSEQISSMTIRRTRAGFSSRSLNGGTEPRIYTLR